MEDVKTLAYKGVRAGVLLYPFVGYLAMVINNELSTLMAPKDLSDRLIGIVDRAASERPGATDAEAERQPRAISAASRRPRTENEGR